MIYNNYPDDYIVINAKWVEWDNDEQRWCFMTEDAFEKAQSLTDYNKQVRKEVCEEIRKHICEDCFWEECSGEHCELYFIIEYIDKIEKGEVNG